MSKNNIKKYISPWALVMAMLFFLGPIILRMYGIDLITDRMIKDEVWKLHFVTAVIVAYYFGSKGAILIAVFSALSAFYVETKLIVLYGKNYSVFIKHLTIEILAIWLFTITIGFMSEKLKEKQRQLTKAYDKLTQLAILEERNNIARDLHDGLAQSLGCMNLKLIAVEDSLSENNVETGEKNLADLKDILNETYAEVRHHIFGLNYKFDSQEPFLTKIDKYFQKYSKISGISVNFSSNIKIELELPLKVQLNLFRIIQEALANVRKHACVIEVQVDFRIAGSTLVIRIKDSGVGFDKNESAQEDNSFGLTIMEQRASAIGATFSITSQPEQGTCIQIVMPLIDSRWSDEN